VDAGREACADYPTANHSRSGNLAISHRLKREARVNYPIAKLHNYKIRSARLL
jgi:hypothetical protein